MTEAEHIPLSLDAWLVVALAGTAMAFAHSAEDEAERWLRVMRLHGRVGVALQAVGVGESPLAAESRPNDGLAGRPSFGPGVVEHVVGRAAAMASARGAGLVSTADLLFALLEVYGQLLDRALYLRGSSRGEVVKRLGSSEQPTTATNDAREAAGGPSTGSAGWRPPANGR